MTSNTMNFGPEWMRRLSKPVTPGALDLNSRGAFSTSSLPTSPLVSPGVNGTQGSFTYSTIAATNTSRRNTLNQESPEDLLKGYTSESNLDDQLNPFKYSKELMLSLYKHVPMPLDFERHEYVTSEESLQPMASISLDENEKKLLSGSVNSELTRRIVQGTTNPSSFIRNERNPSRSGLATPPRSRGGYAQNSKEFQSEVEQKLEQDLTRFGRNISRDSNGLSQDDNALWTGISRRVVGTFDNSGVFRFDNGPETDLYESLEPIEKSCHTPESLEEPGSAKESAQEPPRDQSQSGVFNSGEQMLEKDLAQNVAKQLGPSQANNAIPASSEGSIEATEKLKISTNPNMLPEGFPSHLGFKREDLGSASPQIARWFYKDPAGNVQGPFSTEEMQEWYSAGFFPPSLLVKREGYPSFEPLGVLVRQVGDDKQPFLSAQRPMPPPNMLPHQQMRTQFNRNFLSLPSSPVADKHNPMNIGAGRGSFDPFGAPLTSGFEQNAMGFRRHLESQSRRMDINLDPKAGSTSPWGNNLFGPPLGGNSQFVGDNLAMNGGAGGGFGLDNSRAAFERHQYLQAMQQRQNMQMQQFLQFQQHSPGFQNDLIGNLMPQMSSQPGYEPLLASRNAPMNPAGNPWGIPNGADMFKDPPFPQLPANSQRGDPWSQTKPLSSPGGWSGLGAVTSGISLATEFDHSISPDTGFNDQPRSELVDSASSALAQLRLEEERKQGKLPNQTDADVQASAVEASEPSSDKQVERPEDSQKSTVSAISTPNAWSRSGSAHGSPSTTFATLTPWAKITDEPLSTLTRPSQELPDPEVKSSPEVEKRRSDANQAAAEASESPNQEAENAAAWQSTNAPKKSILEIQKEEEEASKLRTKLQESQSRGSSTSKRYADTVASSTPKPTPITGWTTILGGKSTASKSGSDSKTADSALPGRSAGQSQSKSTDASKKVVSHQEPKPPSPEFLNWCRNTLKGLSGVNTDDLIQMLLTFPLDPPPATMDIIAESVYAYSSSMDGRRFAFEYVKRRKVDAGLVPPRPSTPFPPFLNRR
ncbi:hypothetical protein K493DRAFT_313590 [Basidiobolus meristosporus CBS 931.73]|uniref:GYF domain-containing protein n=1 Tax=Basidiobolus meristosporus CBS 931.73 TaxID=1314790 RepID=A0A1Y1YKQ2_9FUNG|nr:hypothetical protein K493DRAFT_313590 [Basidiobolus meristosporus CBS 931.73]|eukprot:ORX98569.1 hypothetical protein K493DRAFT_313590 [Basidiobolus meristosporus CBS 931.73]